MAQRKNLIEEIEAAEANEEIIERNDKEIIKNQAKEIEELKNQMNQLMALLMNNGASKSSSLDEEIKIIHLADNPVGLTTHIELSNITLDFTSFGEERTLDRRQAEELAGKKRSWFEDGIIAFGAGSENLAKKFALKSIRDYEYINPGFLESLANLNAIQLEELYNKVCDGHKSFIVGYFKRKITEGKDSRFADPQKIEMLNRVSALADADKRGAFANVILDRSTKNK